MKIDFATLSFGYRITIGGGTPNWATALGQGKEYKINEDPAINEILKGMVYSAAPLSSISTKIGKGGRTVKGDAPDSPMVLAAVFSKVYVNETLIDNGKFILLITRDDSESHAGRLRLKYGPANSYNQGNFEYTNEGFFKKVKKQFGMAEDACWFVYDISIINQNELVLKSVFVNKEGSVDYETTADQHAAWDALMPSDGESTSNIESGGSNRIYYGAPGCGKSRNVSDLLDAVNVRKKNRIRVTFHPEYANCDFVGQILPTIEKNSEGKEIVRYIFNPGPFTLALQTAYNTNEMVYLIIEEINRGNAAAIFGDMFQLLDRVNDADSPRYSESEYPVCNPNMQQYLLDSTADISIREKLMAGIYIPSNLTIFATMNSSDQNVFTLDTAFKRRWSFEQISNNIQRDANHSYKYWYVPGTNVTWESFLTKINDSILDYKLQNQTNEDKRLGKYFVTKDCLTESIEPITNVQDAAKNFAYKVLEYIWNDVCKIGRDDWFNIEKHKTLEDLIDAFISPDNGDSPLSVFKIITSWN